MSRALSVVRALTSEGVLAAGNQNGALSSAHPLVGDSVLAGLGLVALARLRERAAELLQIKRSTLGDRINRCGLGSARTLPHEAHSSSSMATP